MPCLSLRHIHNSRAISKKYRHQKKLAKKAILSQKAGARAAARTAAKASRQSARQAAATVRAAERASRLAKAAKTAKTTRTDTNSHHASRITEESIHIPHQTSPRLPDHPSRADLINAESRLGSTIFGPVPQGHRREFFHDQENIWIWHEDWSDNAADGQSHPHQLTVRYEVRTSGVYKKVSAGSYFKLEGEELENFRRATHAYLNIIKTHLYNNPIHRTR